MKNHLTAEQYEYARKTGDWESGEVLTHGQALNDNQKIVLEWAKEYLTEAKNIAWFIEELAFLPTTGGKLRYREVAHSYESLSNKEKLDLLNIITLWAVEQEEAE